MVAERIGERSVPGTAIKATVNLKSTHGSEKDSWRLKVNHLDDIGIIKGLFCG